ncbi:DUF362 domain-containing protein [Candidatus Bipolaricaulota bacterium]|nr:DUF362 domain-containing protein [Candidatus Bipolaricaulota bacterium]
MTRSGDGDSVNASIVAVIRCSSYDPVEVQEAVNRGLDLLGGAKVFVHQGEHILLKPNLLIGGTPERVVTTHPSVFQAVATAFQTAGAKLSYGDSPGFGKPQTAAQRAGLLEVARELGIELADFTHGEAVFFSEGRQNKQFTIARGALCADGIVSLPKLKSHGLTRMTGAIKNQFGCIPGALKAEFHARLPRVDLFSQMLVDLNRFLKPRLFIMDGIVAMEGNGPRNGTPCPMNVLLFSRDPVALDATVCRLIELDPKLVLPIQYGIEFGLGAHENIEYLGDPIESFVDREFVVNRHPLSTTEEPGRVNRMARRFVVPKPFIRAAKCTKCGTCVSVCPVDPKAVDFRGAGRTAPPVHDYQRCIRCYCCQELCPEGAIEVAMPLLGRLLHRR